MGNSESAAEQNMQEVATREAHTSSPGAFRVPGNPCLRANQQFLVTVPTGATPGQDFPVLAGGFQLMVRCPPDVQANDKIVVSAPNPRKIETFSAFVPKGVNPGEQFIALLNGAPILITCPPGVGKGMKVKVLAPKAEDTENNLRAPFGEAKYKVMIPTGVYPGEPFAILIANGQKVILTCPQTAVPGQNVDFVVPIVKSGEEIRAVRLNYEKEGWVRCLASNLTFQWFHPLAKNVGREPGGRLTKGVVESLAFVRQLSEDNTASLGTFVEFVTAAEATSTSFLDGRTIAVDIAKHVNAPFQTKEAWFRGKIGELQIPWEEGNIRINVRRTNLLVDAMEAFESVNKEDLRKTFRFEFIGEPGIDAGGVSREFYLLVSEQLFNPDIGLFSYSAINQSCCQINPNSEYVEEHLKYFHFCGRLFAKALFDRQLVNAHFVQSLYKHLLSWPITMNDLEALDADVHQNLTKLLDLDDVTLLDLDFTCNANVMGQNIEQELKPGGADCTVTNENLEEYLGLQCKHRLLNRVREQVKHIIMGFYDVIDAPLLTVFDFQELELLLCGLPQIDVRDWKVNTNYMGAFEELGHQHKVVQMFWDVVENDFTQEQRARLLQFVTGTSGVPAAGFAYLQGNDGNCRKFAVNSISKKQSIFPKAHTCFNRIDLPIYESKQELTKFVTIAVQMQVTGFDTE